MHDPITLEKYAALVPIPAAARLLNVAPASLRTRVTRGQVAGVRLGELWFLRWPEVHRLARDASDDRLDDDVRARILKAPSRSLSELPDEVDIEMLELVLPIERARLYRLLWDGIIPSRRSIAGWSVQREDLIALFAAAPTEDPAEPKGWRRSRQDRKVPTPVP